MTRAFLTLLQTGLLAGVVALGLVPLRWVLRRLHAPALLCYALWVIVLLRMVVPVGLLPQRYASPLRWAAPAVERGVEALGRAEGAPDTPDGGAPAGPAPGPAPQTPARPPAGTKSPGADGPAPADVLAGVWLAGAVALWTYLALSYLRLRLRLRTAVRVGLGDNRVGTAHWESGRVASPFVFGLLRPRIYLPPGVEGDTLEYVLRHERQHIRQRDYLVKFLFLAALGLHWYNPALWLAWVLLGRDMELCCDEAVLRRLDGWGSPKGYSAALLSLAAPRRAARLPLGFGETGVRERILHALRYRRPAFWVTAVLVPTAIAALVWCLCSSPAFRPLPQAPPALTVDLGHSTRDGSQPAAQAVTRWDGVETPSPWPGEVPGGAALVSGGLEPSVELAFPRDSPPSRVTAVDYLLPGDGGAPVPSQLSLGGQNGVDGRYYAHLTPHPASTGRGVERRLIVLSCTWKNGRDTNTCDYAFVVELPAVKPGYHLSEPILMVGNQRLEPGGEIRAPYGALVTTTHPQGRDGRSDLTARLSGGGPDLPRSGSSISADAHLQSLGFPLEPMGGVNENQSQHYTLTYTWDDGGADTYSFTVHAYADPPELDLEAGCIRLFGEEYWRWLGDLLPAPASWAGEDVGGRSRAATLGGAVDTSGLRPIAGFATPWDGWLAVAVGQGVGWADNYVYRTHDGGLTWTETGRPEGALWYPTCAAFLNDDVALLAMGRHNGAPVFRTADGGATWTALSLPLPEGSWEAVDIQAGPPMRLTCTGRDETTCTLYSTDDGATWRLAP